MSKLDTNVFPILNLGELSSTYRLYRIRGLDSQQDEYFQNLGHVQRKLSFLLEVPVVVTGRGEQPHVVVGSAAERLPDSLSLTRARARFDLIEEDVALDYTLSSPGNDPVRIKFVQFLIQEPLRNHPELWQLGAGRPFFKNEPADPSAEILHFNGFSVRVLPMPDGGLGLAVSITSRSVCRDPLPARLSRDEFARIKGRHFVYHLGYHRFEVEPYGLSDLNVSEYEVKREGQLIPLLDWIVRESEKPLPPELSSVPRDASVLLYKNNKDETRSAPSPLLYQIVGTSDEEVGFRHGRTLVKAPKRHEFHELVLFPQKTPFDPIVVTYDDHGSKTYLRQGVAIVKAVERACAKPGYAVVMAHHATDRREGQEDPLEALIIRELRNHQLSAAVIHTTVPSECYFRSRDRQGKAVWDVRARAQGRLAGYLRNVALNKVLLTNQRWPFVLATPLHADLTVGIDVKHHTAGFVVVGSNGGTVRTMCRTSRQREQLRADQVEAYLTELLRLEAETSPALPGTVVIHRDGKMFPSELAGARRAIERLRGEGTLAADATLTVLEIAKSSGAIVRLFEVDDGPKGKFVQNPQVGTYFVADAENAYLCATGRAFPRPGTVQPLHVRQVEGPLPLRDALEDVFALTSLAWTRPEDCTRYPITIKLNDRFLGEDATEYDAEAFAVAAILAKEVPA